MDFNSIVFNDFKVFNVFIYNVYLTIIIYLSYVSCWFLSVCNWLKTIRRVCWCLNVTYYLYLLFIQYDFSVLIMFSPINNKLFYKILNYLFSPILYHIILVLLSLWCTRVSALKANNIIIIPYWSIIII